MPGFGSTLEKAFECDCHCTLFVTVSKPLNHLRRNDQQHWLASLHRQASFCMCRRDHFTPLSKPEQMLPSLQLPQCAVRLRVGSIMNYRLDCKTHAKPVTTCHLLSACLGAQAMDRIVSVLFRTRLQGVMKPDKTRPLSTALQSFFGAGAVICTCGLDPRPCCTRIISSAYPHVSNWSGLVKIAPCVGHEKCSEGQVHLWT